MSGKKASPPAADWARRKLAKLIKEHGWAVTGVAEDNRCGNPDCHSPHKDADPFLYTVGLTEAGLPELLLEHVEANAAALVLNGLARQALEEELVPGRGYRVAGVLAEFGVIAVPAPEGLTICKQAKVFYGSRLRVLRIHGHDIFGQGNI